MDEKPFGFFTIILYRYPLSLNPMLIREGNNSDLKACYEIGKELCLSDKSNSSEGALIEFEILKDSEVLTERELTVAILGEKVAGFLLGFSSQSSAFQELIQLAQYVEWDSNIDLSSGDFYYLHIMGVTKAHQHKGIGAALYQNIVVRYPNHGLITAIIEAPFKNLASAEPALRYGFNRVGTFATDNYQGIAGYKSGIYLKNG